TLALGAAVTVASGGMLTRGVSVITMDIGTGVRVSVPTAILSTLTYAARQGILIRSGRAIEQLNKIDTVVFDKTGTLTQGNAGVVGIYTTSRTTLSADEILRLAASAEQGLTHPVAEAITRHAREREVSLVECEEWEYRVGQGVAAGIEGRTVYVGSHRMMAILGYDVSELLAANPDIEASAASQVYVADDQGLLGVILYRDPARPESAEVIRKLLEMGITPYMLSGDMKKVADAVAAELGIEP
ncbi:MAG: HAD-IC family P-type ATPase, partial [Anaerolineae bacterium]|nr:HAD-IC family P-type ATPase [Anaerolineae bacterium]